MNCYISFGGGGRGGGGGGGGGRGGGGGGGGGGGYDFELNNTDRFQAREHANLYAVLRIRDVYPGSRIRLFSISDPGSRILIKEFKYFNPQKSKKMVSKL